MLVEWSQHARAVCRISVAEIRRVWPSAFAIFMVCSLLMADGLLPVMAARHRAELALYSSTEYSGASTSETDGGGGNDDGGGDSRGDVGGGGKTRNTHSEFSIHTVRPQKGNTAAQKIFSHGKSQEGYRSNGYTRNNMAFVSGPEEVVLDSGWARNSDSRTSRPDKGVYNRAYSESHFLSLDAQPELEDFGSEKPGQLIRDRRKTRHLALVDRSSSSDSSLQSSSFSSSSSSSSSSLGSSASSLLSPKGPPSAPSIYHVSSSQNSVGSSLSKSSLKSASLPSSLPSSFSAFSTLSSSGSSSGSSSNRQSDSIKTSRNSRNSLGKSKNKYHALYSHYKHQKQQRLQARAYDWGSHRSLITPLSPDLRPSIRSGNTARNSNSSSIHFYNSHHSNSRANTKHNSNNDNINVVKHGLHAKHHLPMQGDAPFSETDDTPSSRYLQPLAPARYARRSQSTPGNCEADDNGTTSSCQCQAILQQEDKDLVLNSRLIDLVCVGLQSPGCLHVAQNTRLDFCSDYDMPSLSRFFHVDTSRHAGQGGRKECMDTYKQALENDRLAREYYHGFQDLIGRYDCTQSYSVKWNCTHCKQAYKDWLCSNLTRFHRSGEEIQPCSDFCSRVEEMCPFFRPKIDTHAGDPSFICKDPEFNLPNTTILGPQCYSLCHIRSFTEINEFYCPLSANWNCSQVNSSLVTACHDIHTASTGDGQEIEDNTLSDDPEFLAGPHNSSSNGSSTNSTSGSASSIRPGLPNLPWVSLLLTWINSPSIIPSCLSCLPSSLVLLLVGHLVLSTILPSPGLLCVCHPIGLVLLLCVALSPVPSLTPASVCWTPWLVPVGLASLTWYTAQVPGR